MSTQVINALNKEEDISYNAWNQFNELKNLNTSVKPTYNSTNDYEEEEEFDEETLIDSAWSKFCQIKLNDNKKPEYKRTSIKEDIKEEIDGAWKEFIENKEKFNKKTENTPLKEEKKETEEETEAIDGAWKEFLEKKEKVNKKVEYVKVTEEEKYEDDEKSEEEYENSAWNNFKSIESEEKLKKNIVVYEDKNKPEKVKIHLADCAWNEFVVSDKTLFDKYEKSLERLEDDVIVVDEAITEESKLSSSEVNEGETTIITDSFRNEVLKEIENVKEEKSEIVNEVKEIEPSEEVKPIENVTEKIKETVKEEIKPVEDIKEEIKETVKEEVKEEVKETVEEEVKEEVKETVEEDVTTEKISKKKKKGKFSKFLKKTKSIFKKVFSHKRKENKI